MPSPLTLWLIVVCALLWAAHRFVRFMFDRPPNLPPGPPRLPLVGAYPLLLLLNYGHMHRATAALARWYRTDVLAFYYRNAIVVTVHSLKRTREVLLNPAIDGRAVFELVRVRDPLLEVHGIFFMQGPAWKLQRRFMLRHMRDFGFGRRFGEFEAAANEELVDFVDMLRNGPRYEHEHSLLQTEGDGWALELPLGFMALTGNMLMQCVLSERAERKDLGGMFAAARQAMVFQRNACIFGRFFSLIPSWRYVFPNGCGYKEIRASAMALHEHVKTIVDREYASFDAAHERHFMDSYFREMEADGADESFGLKQLTTSVVDMMLPSLVAISTAMCLTLKRLMLNPDSMLRAQRDIDAVVGRGRLPTLEDRARLPYVEAVLRESLRLDTLVPSNVSHCTLEDTTIGQWSIPAGTLVVAILESVHRDEQEFSDAHEFRPERLLDDEGRLNVALDRSLPFGLGKRLCAGETFARNMMFLFMAALLQNFDVSMPEGERFVHPDQQEHASGFSKTVPDFRLKFSSR